MSEAQPLPEPARRYLDLRFPEPPHDRPYVLLNMIASADGKAAVEGNEAGLSSPTDKLVLQSVRAHADAILSGAGTARATGANPLLHDPRLQAARRRLGRQQPPLLAVLSRFGELPLDAGFLRRRDFQAIIFLTETSPAGQALRTTDRRVEVLPVGPGALLEMLRRLRQQWDVRQLVLEGGPTTNAAFFHAGLIDEFFLTVSGSIVGGRDTITPVEGEPFGRVSMPRLQLLSAMPVELTSEVYLHWRVLRSPGAD